MEVLHSSDVIGEEIKEEARKKADRILKNANLEIEALRKSLDEKLEKLEEEQKEIYSDKIQKYKDSIFVTLPLKKWKKKMEYVENLLNEALETYFTSLSVDKKLEIIKDGNPGEWTSKIYDLLTGIQLGKVEDKFGWVVKVEE